jgi:hypothetical protein
VQKAQILTQKAVLDRQRQALTQRTCFTGTEVQILTQKAVLDRQRQALTQCTCFTGTEVHILTQKALLDGKRQRRFIRVSLQNERTSTKVLALLVQRYKY